jgi:hypothetical protein
MNKNIEPPKSKAALRIFNLARKNQLVEYKVNYKKWMNLAIRGKEINEHNRFINDWQHSGEAQRAYHTDFIYSDIKSSLTKDENTKNFDWEANFINWAKREDVDEERIKGFARYIAKSDFWDFLHKHERKLLLKNINSKSAPETIDSKQNKALSTPIKINWQGQSNSLIYLFRQLKLNFNKDNEPLVSNSYDDLAIFLKENFSCFNDVKITTIVRQLMQPQKPKKTSKKIELYT